MLVNLKSRTIVLLICFSMMNLVSSISASEKDNHLRGNKNVASKPSEIHPCDVAKVITVKIVGTEVSASGVIITKKSGKYIVLTSAHLLMSNEKNFKIQTSDNNIHPAIIVQRFDKNKNKLLDNDLATLQFNSKNIYHWFLSIKKFLWLVFLRRMNRLAKSKTWILLVI
jgi:hypothetical protein